ncbi:hypothetical protein PQU92_10270 [Asticcacaulis sp. BYS171W]|uniref:Uncharacterized protein n=1 Tax=Asticcacaulis aquaticus TaxID=2984212 RepID=A0ABT5HUK7_9CAUL|nr:hypothetical protein [Asticcacaulis aquaticus]MDC7683664.1 hypothetical protein [Asticcacaulis aquaticus]
MGVLPEQRIEKVKGLVRTLPVALLRPLENSLSLSQDEGLTAVRRLVSAELESHYIKEAVFRPFMPLFEAREDGLEGVEFPNWVLNRLWRALERAEPQLFAEARVAARGLRANDETPVVFYRLVTAGAAIIRDTPDEVLPANADEDDADTLAEFACYLDLHRLLRSAVLRLPDWMGRIDTEKATAIRLMFKDAGKTSEDGGLRFLEALFANLDDGALIMKFVATVSDRPNDRFLSESELAGFGERLIDAAEMRLKVLEGLLRRRNRETAQLSEAGAWVTQCLTILHSFEQSIELSRDGAWGKRVAKVHQTIAALVEDRLKGVEKTIDSALPVKTERIFGRATRDVPDFKGASDEVFQGALQTIAFLNHIRATASHGGFASLLTRTIQGCETIMDGYFEIVLGIAVADDPFDAHAVMACFERVTDLIQALCGEDKANIARRRVASADVYRVPKNVA